MAYVSGPTSGLPGRLFKPPHGVFCDEHNTIPAVHRVQGETDSFGAEYIDMCEECFTKYSEEKQASQNEELACDWCKSVSSTTMKYRDTEEGLCGPVYNVCSPCRRRHAAYLYENE